MHRAKAGLWVPWHVTFSASPSLVMISRVRIAASGMLEGNVYQLSTAKCLTFGTLGAISGSPSRQSDAKLMLFRSFLPAHWPLLARSWSPES
jgi:hypothetical protein